MLNCFNVQSLDKCLHVSDLGGNFLLSFLGGRGVFVYSFINSFSSDIIKSVKIFHLLNFLSPSFYVIYLSVCKSNNTSTTTTTDNNNKKKKKKKKNHNNNHNNDSTP